MPKDDATEVSVDREMEGLAASAIQSMRKYYSAAGEHTEKDLQSARIDVSLLSGFTRLRQANGARDALHFQMARELSTDKKELERYVAVAFPMSPFVKRLKS